MFLPADGAQVPQTKRIDSMHAGYFAHKVTTSHHQVALQGSNVEEFTLFYCIFVATSAAAPLYWEVEISRLQVVNLNWN